MTRLSVWRNRRHGVYLTRVWHPDGRSRAVSTGQYQEEDARDVARLIRKWRGKHGQRHARPDVLTALYDGRVSLAAVVTALDEGTLATLMASLTDVDLDALVTEWAQDANAKYVTQVRRMIPHGQRFPVSAFTKSAVRVFLGKLTCTGPTKNRYRAALSVFAGWLVDRDVIETNVVRAVHGYKEHEPREAWISWDDLQRVVASSRPELRAAIALAGGAGLEYGALARLRRTDVDLEARTIHARGSKTRWRNRVVRAEPFVWPIVTRHCAPLVGPALLFPDLTYERALSGFRAALKACGLPTTLRFHDLRHTYAVNALRSGLKPLVVGHQLGHKDATMVIKVYGKFAPDATDYERPDPPSATHSAIRT